MSFYLFLAAAIICLLSVYVHGVWGRGLYAGFIKDSNLPDREKGVSLVSWDVFTVMLAVSGLVLIYVAFNPETLLMVYPIMLMQLGGAVVFFYLTFSQHKSLSRLPGGVLMGSTGGLVWLGLYL